MSSIVPARAHFPIYYALRTDKYTDKNVPARAHFLIYYVQAALPLAFAPCSGQSAFPDLLRTLVHAAPNLAPFRPERIS